MAQSMSEKYKLKAHRLSHSGGSRNDMKEANARNSNGRRCHLPHIPSLSRSFIIGFVLQEQLFSRFFQFFQLKNKISIISARLYNPIISLTMKTTTYNTDWAAEKTKIRSFFDEYYVDNEDGSGKVFPNLVYK